MGGWRGPGESLRTSVVHVSTYLVVENRRRSFDRIPWHAFHPTASLLPNIIPCFVPHWGRPHSPSLADDRSGARIVEAVGEYYPDRPPA